MATESTDNNDLEVEVTSQYKCPICAREEQSASKLELHVNEVHFKDDPQPLCCPFCSESFTSSHSVEQHVTDMHPEIPDQSSVSEPQCTQPIPEGGAVGGTFGSCDDTGVCPVCCRRGFTDAASLNDHLEEHFNKNVVLEQEKRSAKAAVTIINGDRKIQQALADQEFAKFQAAHGMDERMSHKDQSRSDLERAAFRGDLGITDMYERRIKQALAEKNGIDDNLTRTGGIIERLLPVCLQWRDVKRVHLCSSVDHFSSTYGDKGWGCGYRNIQMLLSSLQHCHQCKKLLHTPDGEVPSIPELQRRIEAAWHQGFDGNGCEQLGGKVLNTRKWIGATELVALLSSMRIKCELLDFHRPTGPNSSHPVLLQWCLQYFSRDRAFIPPLYLQHQGHSRTVIGCEVLTRSNNTEENPPIRLLVLDPSHSPALMSTLSVSHGNTRDTLGENFNGNLKENTRDNSYNTNTKENSKESSKENMLGNSSTVSSNLRFQEPTGSTNTIVGYTLSGERVVEKNSDWGRGRGRAGEGRGRGRGRGRGGSQYKDGTITVATTLRALRKPLNSLCKEQYQIVAVSGVMESEEEFQRSKVLESTRLPET